MERRWLVVENARIHVNTGLVFDSEGVPVKRTCYLRAGGYHNSSKPISIPTQAEPFGQPLVVGYNCFARLSYYHWMIQGVFSAWLWARSQTHRDALFLTPRLEESQKQTWSFSRVAASSHYQGPEDVLLSVPRAIIIPEAFRPGAIKPSPLLGHFAQDISDRVSDSTETKSDLIYVSRRDSRKRALGNEVELESALVKLGFCVVTLSGRSFEDQVRLFRSAKLIVSPHGAGLANVIFCRPGTRVIELMPTVRDNRVFERLAAAATAVHYEVKLIPASGDIVRLNWQVDARRLAESLGHVARTLVDSGA